MNERSLNLGWGTGVASTDRWIGTLGRITLLSSLDKVTLTGTVHQLEEKESAIEMARTVPRARGG